MNAQFVAVEMETPFARTARGMISGGLNGILSRFYTIIDGLNLQEPRDWPPTDVNVRTNLAYEVTRDTYLKPNAALKTMTQTTTALGVSGTSMYIHQPVRPSAIAICTRDHHDDVQ